MKILETIEVISTEEQYVATKSYVEEFDKNNINLNFIIEDSENIYVKKINIFGNNVTRENVIRNQLEIDEGDPYNEILMSKSINNLRNMNFLKMLNLKN